MHISTIGCRRRRRRRRFLGIQSQLLFLSVSFPRRTTMTTISTTFFPHANFRTSLIIKTACTQPNFEMCENFAYMRSMCKHFSEFEQRYAQHTHVCVCVESLPERVCGLNIWQEQPKTKHQLQQFLLVLSTAM